MPSGMATPERVELSGDVPGGGVLTVSLIFDGEGSECKVSWPKNYQKVEESLPPGWDRTPGRASHYAIGRMRARDVRAGVDEIRATFDFIVLPELTLWYRVSGEIISLHHSATHDPHRLVLERFEPEELASPEEDDDGAITRATMHDLREAGMDVSFADGGIRVQLKADTDPFTMADEVASCYDKAANP
jgi:hypothetical protein